MQTRARSTLSKASSQSPALVSAIIRLRSRRKIESAVTMALRRDCQTNVLLAGVCLIGAVRRGRPRSAVGHAKESVLFPRQLDSVARRFVVIRSLFWRQFRPLGVAA